MQSKLFKLTQDAIFHFEFCFDSPKFWQKTMPDGRTLKSAVFSLLNLDRNEYVYVRFQMNHKNAGKPTSAVMRMLDHKKGDRISICLRKVKNNYNGEFHWHYDIESLGTMGEKPGYNPKVFYPSHEPEAGIVDVDDGGPNF